MELKTLSEETPYELAVIGRLDTNTAPELETFMEGVWEKEVKDVTVDMTECDFVSSAGLRVIVAMQKHASSVQGKLIFKGVQSEVMEVFQMTGFDKILTFE